MKKYINQLAKRFGYRIVKPIQKANLINAGRKNYMWSSLQYSEARVLFHYESLKKTQNIKGNIVECGVAEGHTLGLLFMLEKEIGGTRNFSCFDTFEGFPSTTVEDGNYLLESSSKLDRYKQYSLDYVKNSLLEMGLSDSNINKIEFIKGTIPESFKNFSKKKLSLVNLDVDLYEPILSSLQYFWPLMSKGGIIMLDEYDHPADLNKFPGAKLAVDKFCKEEKVTLQRHFTHKTYLVKK